MATQPDSKHHDIESTDELPLLDVAAYEARLSESQADGVSRTDTWTVEALREFDTTAETRQNHFRSARGSQAAPPPIAGRTGVASDVDHIRKRLAEQESELSAAKTLNAELQSRCAALTTDRDGQAQIMLGLQADNARLTEYRTIADEMVARLEQKLRDQPVLFTKQLTELQSARFDEHLKAGKTREELQQQIAQKAVQLAALQESHEKLREELQNSIELAAQRADSVRELRALLVEEETGAEQLALQLAAKLRDSDTLSAMVAARNQTITELRSQADGINDRWQQTLETVSELSAQLEAVNAELADSRAQQSARESGTADSRQQMAQMAADIERLTAELQSVSQERDSILQALNNERDSLLRLREELDEKSAGLAQSHQMLADAQRDSAALHAESAALSETVRARDGELISAQALVSELRRDRDGLKQGLEEAWQAAERLQAEAHTHLQLLHAKTAELSAVKHDLNQHGPALRDLEYAMRARDELTEQVRQQLQTTQDEHAIMTGQLQKSRLRVKSMAEQIFQRDNQIAALKTDLAVHVEALAAIRRDVNRVDEEPQDYAGSEFQRVLQPVDHDGDPIVLDRKVITIGRTAENDICLPSKLISRHHARLLVSPNGVIIEDAGSTNGCFVNGKQIAQQLLGDGDVLEIGDLRFRLYTPSLNDTRARNNVIEFSGK
jgi:chromosome segregation ATPase